MDRIFKHSGKTHDLVIFCSNRDDGNMSYGHGKKENVEQNRVNFLNRIGIDYMKCVYMNMNHSDIILPVDEININNAQINADGIVLTDEDCYIFLNYGDCIPFVIFDQKKSIVGYAHLSWKSICKNLHIKLLDELVLKYKSALQDLYIYFGPSILVNSYLFEKPAQLEMNEWKEFVNKVENGYSVDLVGYVTNDIIKKGIMIDQINYSGIDTGNSDDYFSHYRSVREEGFKEGRFMYGVGLKSNSIL